MAKYNKLLDAGGYKLLLMKVVRFAAASIQPLSKIPIINLLLDKQNNE
jgi:hypothetical protein